MHEVYREGHEEVAIRFIAHRGTEGEFGEWRVASGEWRVASGEWRVASYGWRVTGNA